MVTMSANKAPGPVGLQTGNTKPGKPKCGDVSTGAEAATTAAMAAKQKASPTPFTAPDPTSIKSPDPQTSRPVASSSAASTSGAAAAASTSANTTGFVVPSYDEYPNQIVYRKMEKIVEKMQDEKQGIRVRTVKSLRSKIPSVFTGAELVAWMQRSLNIEEQADCLQLACLIAAHGYFFPIDDHVLTVKGDGTYYRFQTPYYWPSNSWEPENTDYAVYLCKRTMQNKTKMGLADYEAENLARLQRMFSRKWEFIFMQAEAQAKVDKRRDKMERKILDSQERAFWDVHRPAPGCVNTTELDIKKACRMNKPSLSKWAAMVSGNNPDQQESGVKPSSGADAVTGATLRDPAVADKASTSKGSSNPGRVGSTGASSSDANASNPTEETAKPEEKPEDQSKKEQYTREMAVEYHKQEIKLLQKKLERLNLKFDKASESHRDVGGRGELEFVGEIIIEHRLAGLVVLVVAAAVAENRLRRLCGIVRYPDPAGLIPFPASPREERAECPTQRFPLRGGEFVFPVLRHVAASLVDGGGCCCMLQPPGANPLSA
ncbi:unnamed protein product [Notodromas monacha]|uniref:DEP domain-containing protein n=1 Tax=Notodromas monacha TaxID=399045 RepID=A0A7R9BGG7_9CRUS|nr:unnamed protein product [Notodromas monacha]CAG0913433.1 unnamed protein product [Notodromas monacha]